MIKIYFAGIPAGDGKIEDREAETLDMIGDRLVSYHFILNKAHPMDVIKEKIRDSYKDLKRRGLGTNR